MEVSFQIKESEDDLVLKKKPLKTVDFNIDLFEMSRELKNSLDMLSNEMILNDIQYYNSSKILQKIIFLQRYIRKTLHRLFKWKDLHRKIKAMKYRKNVVNEIVITEESFVQSLDLLIKNVLIPLKINELKLEDKNLRLILDVFSNIESIKNFNEKLCLKLMFLKKYSHLKVFGKTVLDFLPFFKLYFVYCNEFEEHNILLQKIRNDEENIDFRNFKNWVVGKEHTPLLNNMDMNSILIKPIQRLPKYILLFKDLLKHTEETHEDFEFLKKCLQKFVELNEENNKRMDNYIRNMKLFELQTLFGSNEIVILDSKREFKGEEALGIIKNNINRSVICYFLSDMILVTERSVDTVYKLIYHINLNDDSFIKDLPNSKYFSDLFSVNGCNICLTFSADNSENKQKYMILITNILDKLREKKENKLNLIKKINISNQSQELIKNRFSNNFSINLKVNAIGTEERNYSNFGRFTVYIIEIKLNEFAKRIYIRYSEMIELYNIIKENFKDINIPKISNNHWLTHRKTKIIESRKMLIENFLQNILKNEKIINEGKKVLSFLNLPLDLYEIFLNKNNNKSTFNLDISQSSLQGSEIIPENLEKDKEKESPHDSTSSKFKKSYFIKPPTFLLQKSSTFLLQNKQKKSLKLREANKIINDKYSKSVNVQLPDNSFIKLNLNMSLTADEAVEIIARKLGLIVWIDFRIFIIDEDNNTKLIDDDEILFRFFCNEETFRKTKWKMENKSLQKDSIFKKNIKKKKNFFESFKKNITGFLFPDKKLILEKERKIKLLFRKYLYMSHNLEKQDFLEDLVRAKLLTFQIFSDIDNFKYHLKSSDYILLTALYTYITFGDSKLYVKNPTFLQEMAQPHMPELLLKLRQTGGLWVEQVSKAWEKISKDIDIISNKKIQKKNKLDLENSFESRYSKHRSNSLESSKIEIKGELNSMKCIIACYTVIHMFENFELFGAIFFWVEIYEHQKTELMKYMLLAIKFEGIRLLKINDKSIAKEWLYEEIKENISQPKSLILKIKKNGNDVRYRFNTFKSFEICQIIEEYKSLRKLYNLN